MTSQRAIDRAKEIAANLSAELKPFGVSTVMVDDWGDHNNFGIIVQLNMRLSVTNRIAFRPIDEKAFNLRKIGNVLRKLQFVDDIFNCGFDMPKTVYTTTQVHYRRYREFDGWDKDDIVLSLTLDGRYEDEPALKPRQTDAEWGKWYEEQYG